MFPANFLSKSWTDLHFRESPHFPFSPSQPLPPFSPFWPLPPLEMMVRFAAPRILSQWRATLPPLSPCLPWSPSAPDSPGFVPFLGSLLEMLLFGVEPEKSHLVLGWIISKLGLESTRFTPGLDIQVSSAMIVLLANTRISPTFLSFWYNCISEIALLKKTPQHFIWKVQRLSSVFPSLNSNSGCLRYSSSRGINTSFWNGARKLFPVRTFCILSRSFLCPIFSASLL